MNREQKRAFVKRAHKQGMKTERAKTFADILSGTGEHTAVQEINEGDKIKLDITAITSRKNYERMSPAYKSFVESAGDTVFTAHKENLRLISLVEEPKWLFWCGDLIVINKSANT